MWPEGEPEAAEEAEGDASACPGPRWGPSESARTLCPTLLEETNAGNASTGTCWPEASSSIAVDEAATEPDDEIL